jgi:hypothetical protein
MGTRCVGNELAGPRQAMAHQHQTAALRHAEADLAAAAGHARLTREAADAAALARALDERAATRSSSTTPVPDGSPTPP